MTLDVRARPIGLRTRQSRPEVVHRQGGERRTLEDARKRRASFAGACRVGASRPPPTHAPFGCEPSGAHPYTGCRARPFCVSSVNSRGVDLSAALSERGDLSREIRLQGSNGVEFGMLLCDPSSNVGLGPVVGSQTSHGDNALLAARSPLRLSR
jgi:hypothetical protein